MPRPHRIAIIVSMEHAYGRGILRGVTSFAHPDQAWVLKYFPLYRVDVTRALREWRPDGIVGHTPTDGETWAVNQVGVPFVNCCEVQWGDEWSVCVDDIQLGRLGAEHLLGLGLGTFAFCGDTGLPFSRLRLTGFRERLREAGHSCGHFEHHDVFTPLAYEDSERREAAFSKWLHALPKPVGLLCQNDNEALRVTETCLAEGISIPGDISLLGVDNDPGICEIASPRVSSLINPSPRIGFEAAEILKQVLEGGKPERRRVIAPGGIEERESTDRWHTSEPAVARALQCLRANRTSNLGVQDLVAASGVSRRVLERRILQAYGCTPRELIERFRLDLARELLRRPELRISEVSEKCGFSSAMRFSKVFRQKHHCSPRAWRQQGNKAIEPL